MDHYYNYTISAFGNITGEDHIINELQNGPIACAIAVPDTFENFTGTGVYEDKTGDTTLVHGISVVGYGATADAVKYWLVRNSWGSAWGDKGFVKVIRGINNIGIESDCSWADPVDTWSDRQPLEKTEPEPEHSK